MLNTNNSVNIFFYNIKGNLDLSVTRNDILKFAKKKKNPWQTEKSGTPK